MLISAYNFPEPWESKKKDIGRVYSWRGCLNLDAATSSPGRFRDRVVPPAAEFLDMGENGADQVGWQASDCTGHKERSVWLTAFPALPEIITW